MKILWHKSTCLKIFRKLKKRSVDKAEYFLAQNRSEVLCLIDRCEPSTAKTKLDISKALPLIDRCDHPQGELKFNRQKVLFDFLNNATFHTSSCK